MADDLLDSILDGIARRLARAAGSVEALPSLRSDAITIAAFDTLRVLGLERKKEVAPLRRGVGEVGFEVAWGRGLQPDYAALATLEPKDLFVLDLVAEVCELGFRPGTTPERVVEDAALDMAKLIWARADTKVLVFGAHRSKEIASSIDALWGGFSEIIVARDPASEWHLVALPNLFSKTTLLPGAEWRVQGRTIQKGQLGPLREKTLSSFVSS